MNTKILIFSIIALLLLSCNNNHHRRHENRSQENTAEIPVSEKPVSAFQIKKGLECSVKVVGMAPDFDGFDL